MRRKGAQNTATTLQANLVCNIINENEGIAAQAWTVRHLRDHTVEDTNPADMVYKCVDATELRLIMMWRKRGMSLGEIAGLLGRCKADKILSQTLQ